MSVSKVQLRSTAYHEAGHAIAAWALGVGLRDITIVPDGDALGSAAHTRILNKRTLGAYEFRTSLSSFEGETSALRTAVICLAGIVAQRRHAQRSVRNWHGRDDYKTVILLAGQVAGDDEKEMKHWYLRASRRTERLIDWKWPAVEALASALIKKRKLSGEEALAAIHSAYELPKTEQRRLAKIVEHARILE